MKSLLTALDPPRAFPLQIVQVDLQLLATGYFDEPWQVEHSSIQIRLRR